MDVLEELPASLKSEVLAYTHQKIFQNIHFFKDKEPEFLLSLLFSIKQFKIAKDEILYRSGEYASESIFLLTITNYMKCILSWKGK